MLLSLVITCAGKKPFWGDETSGFIMTYQLAKDQKLKYEANTTQKQTMEMMGQSMETVTTVVSKYSITGVKLDEKKNINSTVNMQEASIKVKSPMGEQTLDLSAIMNKDFGLIFSGCGKKVAFSNPENIEVNMGMAGKRSAESFFRNLLPRLASKPIKIGESWTVDEIDTVKEGGLDILVDSKTTHTLAGLENIDNLECMKITAKATVVLEGAGQQMGADVNFEGDGEMNATWYFAYKKGVFVKSKNSMLMEGTATVTGPQNMTIPMTQETTIEVNLVQ